MRAQLLPLGEMDERLEHQWRELAQHSLEPNPSFEPGMTLNAAALPEAPEVALLIVHDTKNRLQMLAPVTGVRRYRRVPVPALRTWVHDYCLLGTPLVAPADPAASLGAAVHHLVRENIAPWWVLEDMSANGPVVGALHEVLRHQGIRATSFLSYPRGAVVHHRAGDQAEGGLSGKSLGTLRRKRRRLSEALSGEVQTIDAANDGLNATVEGFLRTEASGWKGPDGGAFLSRPGHADFFRALCRDFASESRLQFFRLGTPSISVAYQCNLIGQDQIFRFKITYDEDYRRFSPGALLDLDAVQSFRADDHLRVFDSCTHPDDEADLRLFPDRVAITSLLIPLRGLRGQVAARGAPALTATGRRIRQGLLSAGVGSVWKKRR